MILFCDTSALLKLYVLEEGSELVRQQCEQAEAVVVCRIAWAEAHAAFSRRAREVAVDVERIEEAKAALADDWPHFILMEINQALVERAGDFADTFALRGYDSVHLAAAFEAARIMESPVCFACFDHRLNKAAKALGMSCIT